jgi:hypothetical protein
MCLTNPVPEQMKEAGHARQKSPTPTAPVTNTQDSSWRKSRTNNRHIATRKKPPSHRKSGATPNTTESHWRIAIAFRAWPTTTRISTKTSGPIHQTFDCGCTFYFYAKSHSSSTIVVGISPYHQQSAYWRDGDIPTTILIARRKPLIS